MSFARGIRNACLPSLILWALIVWGVLSLVSCSEPEYGGSIELPPEQYQRNTSAAVHFGERFEVTAECQDKVGHPVAACATIGGPNIWIENPCDVARFDRGQWYARLLCHEMGHANGWPADHSRS
jgi:hypothetical protein